MGFEQDLHQKVMDQIMRTLDSDPAQIGTAQVATIKAAIKKDLRVLREKELQSFDALCKELGI